MTSSNSSTNCDVTNPVSSSNSGPVTSHSTQFSTESDDRIHQTAHTANTEYEKPPTTTSSPVRTTLGQGGYSKRDSGETHSRFPSYSAAKLASHTYHVTSVTRIVSGHLSGRFALQMVSLSEKRKLKRGHPDDQTIESNHPRRKAPPPLHSSTRCLTGPVSARTIDSAVHWVGQLTLARY